MPTYILKTIARYEFDADSHEEALKIYQEGLWNYNDMTDEDAFELLHIDDKLTFHDITPKDITHVGDTPHDA